MRTATRNKKGFTLVEILIVVVILGILAAIVIPQFTNASESAKSSSLYTQLQTLRSQLELYQVQHNGVYPTLAQLNANSSEWGVMTNKTTVTGSIDNTNGEFGPYLQQAPQNPFTLSTIAVDNSGGAATGTASDGWLYNENNGDISAVGFNEATGEYTAP